MKMNWYDVKQGAPIAVHGFAPGAGWRRLPADLTAALEPDNPGLTELATCSAGVRARFISSSPSFHLRVRYTITMQMVHMTLLGQNGFDLYVVEDGMERYAGSLQPPHTADHEATLSFSFPTAARRELVLYWPLFAAVSELSIGVPVPYTIEAPTLYSDPLPIVAYGSSITHGGCASRPGNAWPAILGRMLQRDVHNLGFSGHAKGERPIASHFAAIPASVIILDYDHNAPDAAHLERTLPAMVEEIRASRPRTPLVLISKPDVHQSSAVLPGTPADREERARRTAVIRGVWEDAVAAGDERIWFIDGAELFLDMQLIDYVIEDVDVELDEKQRSIQQGIDACTVDGCHPNDLGFWRMASRIRVTVEEALLAADTP